MYIRVFMHSVCGENYVGLKWNQIIFKLCFSTTVLSGYFSHSLFHTLNTEDLCSFLLSYVFAHWNVKSLPASDGRSFLYLPGWNASMCFVFLLFVAHVYVKLRLTPALPQLRICSIVRMLKLLFCSDWTDKGAFLCAHLWDFKKKNQSNATFDSCTCKTGHCCL